MKNKGQFLKLIFKLSGFTLPEFMVGMAMGTFIIYGGATLFRGRAIILEGSLAQNTWLTKKLEVTAALNSLEGCTYTLVTPGNIKINGTANPTVIYNKNNRNILTSNTAGNANQYPSSNPHFSVSSITVSDTGLADSTGKKHYADVTVNVSFSNSYYGRNTDTSTFRVLVAINTTTNVITGCGGADTSFSESEACQNMLGGTLVDIGGNNYRCLNIKGYQGSGSTINSTNTNLGSLSMPNPTGTSNTSLGYNSLHALTTGQQNTSIGYQSGLSMTTGSANTLAGYQAGGSITSGYRNIGIGYVPLAYLSTGYDNVGIGYLAGGAMGTNSAYNIYIGASAGGNIWGGGAVQTGNIGIGETALGYLTSGTYNVAIGRDALRTDTGNYNTAVGRGAGPTSGSGTYNTALGAQALYNCNGTCSNQTALGYQAMANAQDTVYGNTAAGYQALMNNDYGDYNTAIGSGAHSGAAYGSLGSWANYNVALGANTLIQNTRDSNTAVGMSTMESNTTGYSNTALGAYAMNSNESGAYNTAIGYLSLASNTSGHYNIAVGNEALTNENSNGNVAVGYRAGYNHYDFSCTTGLTALGHEAMFSAIPFAASGACTSTAIGYQASYSQRDQKKNVAFGYQAGYNVTSTSGGAGDLVNVGGKAGMNVSTDTSPYSSVNVGYQAGYSGTANYYSNVAVGVNSAYSLTGNYNTAVGEGSLFLMAGGNSNTSIGPLTVANAAATGSSNTMSGYNSLYYLTTGNYNTTIGHGAGITIQAGSYNTAIGHNANNSWGTTNDSNNVFIGGGAGSCATTRSNTFFVTSGSTCGANTNYLMWGLFDTDSDGINEARLGIGGPYISNRVLAVYGGSAYQNVGYSTWVVPSDMRLKDFKGYFRRGLDALMPLKTILFKYNKKGQEAYKLPQNEIFQGVSAQQVRPYIPEAVSENSDGILNFSASPMYWTILNATKEQKTILVNFDQVVERQESEDKKRMASLTDEVVAIQERQEKILKEMNLLQKRISVKNKKVNAR